MIAAGILAAADIVLNQDEGGTATDADDAGEETENDSGDRITNPTKGDSPVWKGLENAGNGRRKSGTGAKTRYYEWDHTHNDIEVYDNKGRHLGSMDPTSGELYKPSVPGRRINF